jgi:hypothetical protein
MSLRVAGSLIALFIVSQIIVFCGVLLGVAFYEDFDKLLEPSVYSEAIRQYDARSYVRIAEGSYGRVDDYNRTFAFFPGYPLVVRVWSTFTGMTTANSAVAVSNAALFFSSLMFYLYASCRTQTAPSLRGIAAFLFFPTTFFFRMPFSESVFVSLCLLFMLGTVLRWHPMTVAVIAGLATLVRPVGVAMSLPLCLYVLDRTQQSRWRLAQVSIALLIANAGLLGFMCYQAVTLGNPLAFAESQSAFRIRANFGLLDTVIAYAAWEPIWSVFDPQSPAYWKYGRELDFWFLSLRVANPVIFVAFIALVLIGARNKWLSRYEIWLALPLLLIPYLTKGFSMGMLSQGRYAAVCIPAYLVIGEAMRARGTIMTLVVFLVFAVYLASFSMLFAAGYSLF